MVNILPQQKRTPPTPRLRARRFYFQVQPPPTHIRIPLSVPSGHLLQGIFVRYDQALEGEEKVGLFSSNDLLADVAPRFSEQLIYFLADPMTYVPTPGSLECDFPSCRSANRCLPGREILEVEPRN